MLIFSSIADATDYFVDMIENGLLLDVAAQGLIIEQENTSSEQRRFQPLHLNRSKTHIKDFW
jgi:hypothetical protein